MSFRLDYFAHSEKPYELWESNSILDFEVLDSESGKELEALIESGKWQRL